MGGNSRCQWAGHATAEPNVSVVMGVDRSAFRFAILIAL
jgi:hypothetical protein